MRRVDVGKEAKRFGATRPRDARKVVPEPPKVPPHKKPRAYVLRIRQWSAQEWTHTKRFPSKTAREQARVAILRSEREKKYWTWDLTEQEYEYARSNKGRIEFEEIDE